jgi:hypothetical protein
MTKPTLLIVIGPQGSGNHMWSKILSSHSDVIGWQQLQEEYWVGHDNEPFADCWRNPLLLKEFDFSKSNYWVTSISVPYFDDGKEKTPLIMEFIGTAIQHVNIKVALISRDKSILENQQQRLRERVTLPKFVEETEHTVHPDVYLSFESLHLYGSKYLQHIGTLLDFPVDFEHENILENDSNKKYITGYNDSDYWLDNLARKTSSANVKTVRPEPTEEVKMGRIARWWHNFWREEYELIITVPDINTVHDNGDRSNTKKDLHFSAKKLIKTSPKHFIFVDMKDQRNEIKFLTATDFHIIKIW